MEFPQFKHKNTIKVKKKKKSEVIGVRIDIPTQAALRKKKTKPKETKPKNCPETPHFHRTKHGFLPDLSFPLTTACNII